MPSLKKNFAYSSILTISSYLFPLITYPYVTRVLGVDKIGVCNFVNSIIHYGILFSTMGIGTMAIREIAQYKSDKKKLSDAFSSILTLNFIASIIVIIIILFLAFYVSKFIEYQKLLIIGSSQILFNSLLVEWLYKGLEEFKYITIRSLVIKILYVFAVFIFVKSSDDYIKYFTINVAMVVFNAIVNILYSRNFLSFSLNAVNLFPYIKPYFVLGIYNILTSMYTSFNITYLGLVSGTTEVGYYTTATKLYTLVLSLFTAFTGVMLPRLSALLSKGNTQEFLRLSNKSVDILLACVIPLVVYLLCYAEDIVLLIAGSGYEGAITPLRIIVPLLVVIGYEQIIVIQMLMPMKKDKAILINSIAGAVVGVLLNLLIVPQLKSTGSAIVWIISELTVMMFAQFFLNKYISFSFPWRKLLKRSLIAIPILSISIFLRFFIGNHLLLLSVGGVLLILYYCAIELLYFKNEYLVLALKKIINAHK